MKIWQILVGLIMVLATLIGASAAVYYYDNFANDSCMSNWHCTANANFTRTSNNLNVRIGNQSNGGAQYTGSCYLILPQEITTAVDNTPVVKYDYYINYNNIFEDLFVPNSNESRSLYQTITQYQTFSWVGVYPNDQYTAANLGASSIISAGGGTNPYVQRNSRNQLTHTFDLSGKSQYSTFIDDGHGQTRYMFSNANISSIKDFVIGGRDYFDYSQGLSISFICVASTEGECLSQTQAYCPGPPCIENWTETHENVTTCLNGSQIVRDVYVDSNSCGTTNNLPGENGTTENISCTFCNEDWDYHYLNSVCYINDSFISQKLYNDRNNCNTTMNLPVDNGTISTLSCNYCSEHIVTVFTAYSDCQLANQTREKFFSDINFNTCCSVTGLVSDCHINNGSYTNTTESRVCTQRFDTKDLIAIINDGLGTTGVSIVKLMDLIIIALVIAGAVVVTTYFIGRLK